MCMGGGSAPAPAPARQPAPAAPATVQETVAPELGISEEEKKRKAQLGKRDLRVDVGSLDPATVGAGVTSGINVG